MRPRLLTAGLGAAGMVLLAAFAWQLAADVFKVVTREDEEPLADQLAKRDLALVPEELKAPEALQVAATNGWFPNLRQPIFSWEDSLEGWEIESGLANSLSQGAGASEDETGAPVASEAHTTALKTSPAHASDGRYSLEIPVRFPDPVTVYCQARHLRGVRFIAYDLFLPADARGYVGGLFFLKDKDGRWYQARSHASLRPGKWTTVTADIRGGSPDVEPLGHTGQWDENQASQIVLVGLTLYGDQPFTGSVFLDRFRGWLRADRFLQEARPERLDAMPAEQSRDLQPFVSLAQKTPSDPLKLVNLRTSPATTWSASDSLPQVELYDSFTVRFDLNREIRNPFDPAQADVQAEITTPSNETYNVPAFWYQDFERNLRFASEELIPVGRPEWRLRFTPRETGLHRVRLHVSLENGQEQFQGPELRFEATPGDRHGFIRVAKANPYFFEYENGEFFYPIGHNVHTPIDVRCWSRIFQSDPPIPRGLTMYEDIFPKMAAHGENAAEVWMASWWVGIEWTRRWPHFHGPGRYSLERAWLLDRLFDLARANGIRIHLVLDNHGKFSSWCDEEWAWNPYNRSADPAGFLRDADEIFTDPKARELHNRRLRYIAARWAGETGILGWEIVSEYDLTGGRPGGGDYRNEIGHKWALDTARYLREHDPYQHPITNHYSGNYAKVDMGLMSQPQFDYIVGDGYRGEGVFANLAVTTSEHFRSQVRKPFWLTEYGGNWSATTDPRLHADLHAGMWSTWMTQGAGTPLFWWYDFIDQKDLYGHFRGFANYVHGEDRRRMDGKTSWMSLQGNAGGLQGLQYRWDRGAYAWIYNQQAILEWPDDAQRPKHEGIKAIVPDLPAGTYRVEFWNTLSGQIVGTQNPELKTQGPLALDLPPFEIDLALKIKRVPEESEGYPPIEPTESVLRGEAPPAPPGGKRR